MPSSPRDVLRRSARIAVVGCSATPGKDAHDVPLEVLQMGYDIVAVNSTAKEIFGKPPFAKLADVPGPIDIVDVFRPASEAPQIARDAVAVGARALWLQTGIRSDEARRIAEEAGIDYVEDRCIRTEAHRLAEHRNA